MFPRSGQSLRPAGLVWTKVPNVIDAFERGALEALLDQVITPDRINLIIEQARTQSLEWVKDRGGRRDGLVGELRTVEKSRSNLYSVLELHGKDAPNLGDLTVRLRALNERTKKLEAALIELENEPIAPGDYPEIDPVEASEALRAIVMECADPRKLREFVGSFVKEVTVGDVEVVVDYHPECLVRLGNRTRVHSAKEWLPVLGTLRTARLVFQRPKWGGVGSKRCHPLTLAA